MITVSVCMIVKNEETVLARCLDSLAGIADEIIVVDTGSTDSTPEIARRYTAHVFPFEWRDDFAAARNFAFSKATMEYIYSADADEVLDEENRRKFLELKQELSPETDIVEISYANQLQFNTNYNFDAEYRPKLYRRLRTFRWVEPVHEAVDLQVHVLKSDVTVRHMPTELHSPRDFGIFHRMTAKGPLDSRLHRMYAKELFIAGSDEDFLAAYPYFEATLHEEERCADDIRVSQCVVSRAARLQKNETELFKAALKNLVGGEPCAEVCCELGALFFEKADYEEAATWYYTAAFGAKSELDIHASGDFPLLGLSKCFAAMGLAGEAEKYRAQADAWKASAGE